MHGPTCIVWANLTIFSLKVVKKASDLTAFFENETGLTILADTASDDALPIPKSDEFQRGMAFGKVLWQNMFAKKQ
jgi:hypothetical protein